MRTRQMFGTTMKRVMDEKGLKPVDIWRDNPELSQQYVSKVLTGRMADPAFDKACAIIDRLGLTLDEFAALQRVE